MLRFVVPALAAACLGLCLVGRGSGGQEPGAAIAPTNAAAKPAASESRPETHRAVKGPFRIEVKLEGVLESARSAEIMLQPHTWTAYKVETAVAQGTRVNAGQELVRFETREIDREIQTLTYARELAELTLQQTEHELKLLEQTVPMDVELAERRQRHTDDDLQYFLQVDRPYSERSIEFNLKAAEFSVEYAEEELAQLEKMYAADDLTEETEEIILKRTRRDVEFARFMAEGARLQAERMRRTSLPRQEEQLQEAAKRGRLQLARARATLPALLLQKRVELQKQRFELQQSADRLTKLQHDRQGFVVKAPLEGIVYYGLFQRGKWTGGDAAAQQLKPGGTVPTQQVFLTIVQPAPLHVRADVPEKELHHIRPGVRGRVTPTAYPSLRVPVRVAEVSAIPVAPGQFDGRFEIQAADRLPAGLVPGMACTLRLVPYEKPDAITVPATAVFTDEFDEQRRYVYIPLPGGRHEQRTVTIGRETEQTVEILEGLQVGDEILQKKPDQK